MLAVRIRYAPPPCSRQIIENQWQPVADRLREMIPELLVLGDHAPAERRGPAIWIKCMLARTLEEADWPTTAVPIIYLPGVSRADLRHRDLST